MHTSQGPTSQPMSPPPIPQWTPDDEAKLAVLEQERAQDLKTLKLETFKKLKPEIRQQIMDSISLQRDIISINYANLELRPELLDLMRKKDFVRSFNHRYSGQTSWNQWQYQHDTASPIFKVHPTNNSNIELETNFAGITVDDLYKAHTEQTVDEEVLDDKP